MNKESATPSQWERYRSLIEETSKLEYEIIGILSAALCRREGDGQPDASESNLIRLLKEQLQSKFSELNALQKEVVPIIEAERVHRLQTFVGR
ncbi:MAG TPA: hypothetical protein VGO45_13860 [Bacteroidia bacterium]|jgi:hypothetical protein|nr:hypothetical protein [Bacteroidia bacterium]